MCYALHRVQTFLRLFSAISTRVFTDNLLVYGFRFCGVTFVLHDDADFKHRIGRFRRFRVVFHHGSELVRRIVFFTLIVIQLTEPVVGVRLIR